MRRIVLLGVIVIAVGGFSRMAAQAPQPELSGVYRCNGMNPDGTAYQGVVEISKLRNTFRVRWTMDDGSIMGVGIFSNGIFAVSYFGGAPAVVVYRPDGMNLVGEWTMGGIEGAVYRETLTKTDGVAPPVPAPGPREPGPRRREREQDNQPRGGIRL
jgi:hypothetical protein